MQQCVRRQLLPAGGVVAGHGRSRGQRWYAGPRGVPPGPPPGFYAPPQGVPPPQGAELGIPPFAPPLPKPVKAPHEYIKRPPFNVGINIVPQGELWVAERLGKYHTTLEPGLRMLIPLVDTISYRHSSKEQAHEIPNQNAITKDNVMVQIDGILFMKVTDPKKASYNVDNPIYNLINYAQTAMRSEIGKITLDRLFEERQTLNDNIKLAISKDSEGWGVEVRRYEIRDILVSDIVRKSMDLQAEADRKKRKNVLESEGDRDAQVNRAEGEKQARELVAEAERIAAIKQADAQAESLRLIAAAQAEAIATVADTIQANAKAGEAMKLEVAKRYLDGFSNIAKQTNTVLLPSNLSDPSSMIASAMGVLNNMQHAAPAPVPTPAESTPSPAAPSVGGAAGSGVAAPQATFVDADLQQGGELRPPPPPPLSGMHGERY